ncbi:LysM peptidoglycan-binding domain-containing protein [Serpentinicella sp. ANB-PHB4]|uniref:LysM peptidoglycan-binding domain-containing protein n=1 Tax=Serpentinicella sp. ANB-PHB4 TaxID=3074076 RepID=UPI002863B0C1|nr:LysM peptidoglycan-binding domain-containing protein [Serpentinicella sp. ANB-PHB4]MDR5659056.1 LysM peptidoglycan-binding domain-containing protein [Serpentinicella sp. ANB-PHB4]
MFYNQMPCPQGTTPYIVQAGDTFYRLAIRYNTTIEAIAAANPNVNPNMLMIGQQLCIPTAPPPTTCPEGTMPYTIRAGDTFFAIARRNNISLDALIAANPGVDPDRLFIGQVICVPRTPPPITCPEGTTPYTIRAGDTFFAIARRLNISLDALIAANPGVDPDRLQIGQVICVPKTTPPPAPVCPTLRVGSRTESVRKLQTLLRDAGFDPGPIDGIFGSKTEAAVRAFQRSKGLVVDGIVGIRTWTALGVDCDAPTPPPTCPAGTTPYTIRAGDTFFNLASRFNTTVDAIRRANPGVDPDRLQIGQIICIPS